MKYLLFFFALVLCTSWIANAQAIAIDSSKYPRLVTFTAQQDHANMMQQLGIKRLRPGPSGNESAPNHANYDEALANPCPQLPDVLTTNKGKKVTTADTWWKQRRPEIAKEFEREVYGKLPKNIPKVTWTATITDTKFAGRIPVLAKQLTGRVDNSSYPLISVTINMVLVVPLNVKGPVPVLMMFGRPALPSGTPSPRTEELLAAGWGYVFIDPNSIQADNGAGLTRGIIGLVNKGQPRKPDDWGSLRAWAWAAARGLDYLETDSMIDAKKTGIEGVSRYGKAALVTLAFESRFALGLIGSSGKGGATLHRRVFGEAVESLTGSGEYHWMAGNYLKYGAEESLFGRKTGCDLPVDSHELIAMCAPRLTFISYGIPEKGDAKWLDQQGSWMATVAAGQVFKLTGARDLGISNNYLAEKMPPVLTGMLNGELAWRQHDGGHTDAPNFQFFIPWANKLLKYEKKPATNPIIFADVPDMSMIRVGDTYYMSSTTMHMSPGVPIMKSNDLVNWQLVSYACDTLADVDALNLKNGKNTYGRGSWASCLRYHQGTYYVTTFAQTTGKTYIYTTKDIERGPWKVTSFKPAYHDHSLFFDDDGKVYMIYGAGKLRIAELNEDLSGVKSGTDTVLIENASAPAGTNISLGAEGSQLFKVNGKYYLFNIAWPQEGMRTVIIHRADKITGPYTGRIGLQDLGVAQGGLIDMPDGRWLAYLFRDYGAVGRIPYLIPVKWEQGWPVLGIDGRVPETLDLPASNGLIPGIVASDEFTRTKGDPPLPLIWQWNHNPDNSLWSVTERKGYLRLKTGRLDTSFLSARNTLTQRTIGPVCSGSAMLNVSKMKDGDFAGLGLLQKNYGLVGVKLKDGRKSIVMINAGAGNPEETASIRFDQTVVYLKAECDFRDKKDVADFFYSLDGNSWISIGTRLKMTYTLPHFMGYRFALFNYATAHTGGLADFDFFRIKDTITRNQ